MQGSGSPKSFRFGGSVRLIRLIMFKKQGRASVLNVEPCSKPQCDQEAGVLAGVREPRLCGSAVVSVGAVLKCSQVQGVPVRS